MNLVLTRDRFEPGYTLGTLSIDGAYFCEVCEDTDRHLEEGGEKVAGKTAIPCGRYRVVLSESYRFEKTMPEVLGVPQFAGIRFHGGNTSEDTEGCPLLGRVRTSDGVRDCKKVNEALIKAIQYAESRGEDVWLVVKRWGDK